MLQVSNELKKAYPGGFIGAIFFKKIETNETGELKLRKEKEKIETDLRNQYKTYTRSDLALLEPIKTYIEYYKCFKKTYHVLLQLESVIFKDKSIPNVNPLVVVMFVAELKNSLLTAGHAIDSIRFPIIVDLAKGNESYKLLNGEEKILASRDMMMADKEGIISSIIYGPDDRTKINKNTRDVLYTVYVPPGIPEIRLRQHLNDIRGYIQLIAPDALMEEMEVYQL